MKRIVTLTLVTIGLAACGSSTASGATSHEPACRSAISNIPLADDIATRAGAQLDASAGLQIAADACQPWFDTDDPAAAECLKGMVDLRHSIEILNGIRDGSLKTAGDYAETAAYHFKQC